MAEATTTAAKKQSWWPLIWGLAALLICPLLPYFEAVIPIQQTLLLLVPVVAVCSIVGWKVRNVVNDITIFKSNGLAVEDVICAGYVYEIGLQRGRGAEMRYS